MPAQRSFRPRRSRQQQELARLDDVHAWARTADGHPTLGEAAARLARYRGLTSTDVFGRDEVRETRSARLLQSVRWVRWVLLVVIPFLPLLLVPQRAMSSPPLANRGRAEFLLSGIEVAYGLVFVVQIALLLAWWVWPSRAQLERAVGAVSVLVAVPFVVFSAAIVVANSVVESWTGAAMALALSTLLAAMNIRAYSSLRSVRHYQEQDLLEIQAALREDAHLRREGDDEPGPFTSVGQFIYRMERNGSKTFRRDRARVLSVLEDRGTISPETARVAAELPLGQWHELDA